MITVTGPGVPRMPNGVEVGVLDDLPWVGWPAGAGGPLWNPVPTPLEGGRAALGAFARWMSVRAPAPSMALQGAAERLVGRGPGLTPEGDDLLSGAAIGLHALGQAAGVDGGRIAASLCPADVRARTGALSATLLELAASGAAPEPVHRLIADGDRAGALDDLRGLGSSTGTAIAAGITWAAEYLMGAGRPA